MAEHTPGPWNPEPDDSRGGWNIRYGFDMVAWVPPSANTDARLIAAAPDLLTALVQVLVEEGLPKASFGYAWDAIAKATGKEA